jgi:methylated-DNA-[protein]-cysteine S-methyltransferase
MDDPQTLVAIWRGPTFALAIHCSETHLLAIDFLDADERPRRIKPKGLAAEVLRQLDAYRRDPRFRFDLPLVACATPFQDQVRLALLAVPAGATLSYSDLARSIASGPRAVGNALRCNPVPILVPCHRVTAKRGLGGYGGFVDGPRLEIKRWLLAHECAHPPVL